MGHEKVLGEVFDVGKFEPEAPRAGGDGRLRCEAELCAVAQRLRGPFEKKRGEVDLDGRAFPSLHSMFLLAPKLGSQG